MLTQTQAKLDVKTFFELELEEDFFYELIDGEIVRKKAPNPKHQRVVLRLSSILHLLVEKKDLGEVYTSPIDVFFDEYNSTQPDILFVKKERNFIITNNGIEGAPDLVVEVLSPSTYRYDRKEKMTIYKQFGVKEYWIIDPNNKAVEVYILENNVFNLEFLAIETGLVSSKVLEGLDVEVSEIF